MSNIPKENCIVQYAEGWPSDIKEISPLEIAIALNFSPDFQYLYFNDVLIIWASSFKSRIWHLIKHKVVWCLF